MDFYSQQRVQYRYFTLMAMLGVTMMVIAMLFTYRVIQVGPFMTPGGVFIFALTYTIADVITEVYGIKMVRQVIWSTLVCIIIFNLVCFFLISLPTPSTAHYSSAYDIIFGHNFHLLLGFSVSFLLSDFLNAYALNKWRILLKGRFFWLRSIASSAVGETLFGILAAALMYSGIMSFSTFIEVLLSTWLFKLIIIVIAAYPANCLVGILKNAEGITVLNDNDFKSFNLKVDSR